MSLKKASIIFATTAILLTACSAKEQTQGSASSSSPTPSASASAAPQASPSASEAAGYVKAHKDLVEELGKGKDGGKVNFDQVSKLYNDNFKKLATAKDSVGEQQISAAIEAAKSGSLQTDVAKQLVDKLGQKVIFLAIRSEFKELDAAFADKAKAKADLAEAKTYYGTLKTTVEKRDTAYQTQLVSAIDAALGEIDKAIDSGKKLDFSLAKQVVDKSIMKAFYLASGAEKGYAYKVEAAVKEGKDPKTEQAEGWAFYQSLYGYLSGEGGSKEDADFILNKLDLKTSTKEVKGDEINKAFVRSFVATAKSEYKQSFANFDQDKGAVTALEGALFISVIELDAKKILGEAETKALVEKAGQLVEAAKAKDKAKAEALYKEVETSLDKLAKAGK